MFHFKCIPFSALTTEELYKLMALRQEVFVVEQNCPYLDADGKDQNAWHLMGFDDDGKLIAYARIAPKGITYDNYISIGRIATATTVRRKGFGKKLMDVCFEKIEKLFGTEPIKISAQCYLIQFYESFGFKTVGEEYLEDDIPHIAMIRD